MKRIKEKKERALGTKLFLKAERCNSHKCVMIRRPYRPGEHGQKRRRAISDFGKQLQEKQKIQLVYGLTNQQMRRLFRGHSGNPDAIMVELEKRLDRVVYLLGFAASPRIARQLVSHGHILVNGRKITSASYKVREGNVVSVRPQSRERKVFSDVQEYFKKHEVPTWLSLDKSAWEGTCVSKPSGETLVSFDINLVGQYYMR